MIILGLTFDTHDAAAALFIDGELVAAAEEERFNREKHTKKFPEHSICFCLKKANCSLEDISYIALFMDPKLCPRIIPSTMFSQFPRSLSYLPYGFKWYKRRKKMLSFLRRTFNDLENKRIICVPHHMAHAQSAFWGSGYNKSMVFTIDGRGEYETINVFLGNDGALQKVKSVRYPHSIGYFYSTGTKYLGFTPKYDEYKVMGLASYGVYNDLLDDHFKKLYTCTNGSFKLRLSFFDHHTHFGKRNLFSPRYLRLFGPSRDANKLTTQDANWAFALQRHTESVICELVKYYHNKYPEYNNLCLAGGVALNCSANAKIAAMRLFDRIYVQPAANDAGAALGAAAYVANKYDTVRINRSPMSPYMGPSYSDTEILSALKPRNDIKWKYCEDIFSEAAEKLNKGLILGWFQGAMEFGPRALGNRSILAAPQSELTKDRINACIKHREPFRPFAPAVLKEFADDYFVIEKTAEDMYPFMLATTKARSEKASEIAATIHVDQTSRIQIVTYDNNPIFYRLIHQYYLLSGVAVLLNTSFNIKKEPIVCSPNDALNSFINSNLDGCILGHYSIEKRV